MLRTIEKLRTIKDSEDQRAAEAQFPHSSSIECMHLPIVLAGYSGSGKDTVASRIKEMARELGFPINLQRSTCRVTDRPPRPDERIGIDGSFVSPDEFRKKVERGDFFFHYGKMAYGGVNYGFESTALMDELSTGHTFLVGGELSTAIPLAESLKTFVQTHRISPLVFFVNRPKEQIIEGIWRRPADRAEKEKRAEHIEKTWVDYPDVLRTASVPVHPLWNEDLEKVAREGLNAIQRYFHDNITIAVDIL